MRILMEQLKKSGLVLEGGGMRGIYTAGVLDVFMAAGVTFDGVIGVSAGAIHGCSFVSAQRGRSIRYYRKYCADKRFMSWHSFFTTGDLVNVGFCYHDLPERLDPYDYAAFDASDTEFYVVCSNVKTGRPEYIRIRDMKSQVDYLRASASLPLVSRTVRIDGKKYLDGGLTDSIPVSAFRRMGFDPCVAVLTRERGYRKKPEQDFLSAIRYHKYPEFLQACKNRPEVYNKTLDMLEEDARNGEVFLIRPEKPLPVGRMSHDKKAIEAAYRQGVADGKRALGPMREWLQTHMEGTVKEQP